MDSDWLHQISQTGSRVSLNIDKWRGTEGREVYGREAGEKGENYATLCNVFQSKKCRGGSQQIQGGNRD